MKTIRIISKIVAAVMVTALFFMACSKSDGSSDFANSPGQGGSMARFAVVGDMLYTVSANTLKQFNITKPDDPYHSDQRDVYVGELIETVYPMDTLLYIGSQSGMYIYDISDPRFPVKLGMASHVRSCDPVVVEGKYAYVTLNTNYSWCGSSMNNVLQVWDVTDPLRPEFMREITGLNGPQGLGADGNLLFVCDKGLKIFDISTPDQPLSIRQIGDLVDIPEADNVRNAYDVIPLNGTLILVAKEGLFLFDYKDFASTKTMKFLSKIECSQQ